MDVKEASQVLTIDDAAKLYQGTALTASAIRRLVRSGEIPSRRVGAKYLITLAAIEAWLRPADKRTDATGGMGRIRCVAE